MRIYFSGYITKRIGFTEILTATYQSKQKDVELEKDEPVIASQILSHIGKKRNKNKTYFYECYCDWKKKIVSNFEDERMLEIEL